MRADARGNPISMGRYIGAPITLSIGTSSASVALLPSRCYRLWSSAECFFQFGAPGVVASTSSHPLTAGVDTLHVTDETNTTLAAITSTGSGVLYASELDVNFM